jgi:hypothetical protein
MSGQSYLGGLYSYFAGPTSSPIKTVVKQPEPSRKVQLARVEFPAQADFAWSKLVDDVDTKALQVAVDAARKDAEDGFKDTIGMLTNEQHVLESRMKGLNELAHQTLNRTNTRFKNNQGLDLGILDRVTRVAEQLHDDIEGALKMFREIDQLLPERERIGIHANHYRVLAPLISNGESSRALQALQTVMHPSERPETQVPEIPSRATSVIDGSVSSDRSSSISRRSSPTPEGDVTTTSLSLAEELSRLPERGEDVESSILEDEAPSPTSPLQDPKSEPEIQVNREIVAVEPPQLIKDVTQASLATPQVETPRLRLAPRKSRSSLRISSVKVLPPVASPQLTLPTFERDNDSIHSIASHRSIFSVSTFFSRRVASESTASDRLRQVLRPSTS